MNFTPKGRSHVFETLLIALTAAGSLPAFATETHEFNVPAEAGLDAIRDFASQANVQILVAGENIKDKHLSAVSGEYSTDQGLHILLADSGLTPQYLGNHSIALVTASNSGYPLQAGEGSGEDSNKESPRPQAEEKQSFWARFRLAQASPGVSTETTAVKKENGEQTPQEAVRLDEVVVTAQKRAERLQDTPVAVSVLNPETLAENGQNRLVDYFASVPGLVLSSGNGFPGQQSFTIRGLSKIGGGATTVSTVIDDVPFGISSGLAFSGQSPPDLDPSDLERIEVLRGPQGTLYGSSSIGGLVRMVTRDPSTTAFSGRLEASMVDVPAGGAGYIFRGAVNVPMSDQFAIRASAFTRLDPGYIDQITTNQKNVNSDQVSGGHLSMLWRPSDAFSVKLSAILQNESANGYSQVDYAIPGGFILGSLKYSALPGTDPYSDQQQLYSATIKANIGAVEITSLTGYNVASKHTRSDFSFGSVANQAFPAADATVEYTSTNDYKKSEELRFASSVGNWMDWLAGAYYTNERSPDYTNVHYATDSNGQIVGFLARFLDGPYNASETAAFANLTLHLVKHFDLEVGARESWLNQNYQSLYAEPGYGSPLPTGQPRQTTNAHAFSFLVSPKYEIGENLMAYVRIASGYRAGGPNFFNTGVVADAPLSYGPDTSLNYEVGLKGTVMDRVMTFDVAAYHIDWNDIQISVTRPVLLDGQPVDDGYVINGGKAKSEGVEAAVTVRPARQVSITLQGSINNAVLVRNLPFGSDVYGPSGARLPYSIPFTGGIVVDKQFDMADGWLGDIRGELEHLGSKIQDFQPVGTPRIVDPAYTTLNLGFNLRHNAWSASLYVNNVTDARGITGLTGPYNRYGSAPNNATIIRPRIIGLSLARQLD